MASSQLSIHQKNHYLITGYCREREKEFAFNIPGLIKQKIEDQWYNYCDYAVCFEYHDIHDYRFNNCWKKWNLNPNLYDHKAILFGTIKPFGRNALNSFQFVMKVDNDGYHFNMDSLVVSIGQFLPKTQTEKRVSHFLKNLNCNTKCNLEILDKKLAKAELKHLGVENSGLDDLEEIIDSYSFDHPGFSYKKIVVVRIEKDEICVELKNNIPEMESIDFKCSGNYQENNKFKAYQIGMSWGFQQHWSDFEFSINEWAING